MYEVTAICKTETCKFLDKPSIFTSSVVETQCGECGNMTETTSKELENGSAEETV